MPDLAPHCLLPPVSCVLSVLRQTSCVSLYRESSNVGCRGFEVEVQVALINTKGTFRYFSRAGREVALSLIASAASLRQATVSTSSTIEAAPRRTERRKPPPLAHHQLRRPLDTHATSSWLPLSQNSRRCATFSHIGELPTLMNPPPIESRSPAINTERVIVACMLTRSIIVPRQETVRTAQRKPQGHRRFAWLRRIPEHRPGRGRRGEGWRREGPARHGRTYIPLLGARALL